MIIRYFALNSLTFDNKYEEKIYLEFTISNLFEFLN